MQTTLQKISVAICVLVLVRIVVTEESSLSPRTTRTLRDGLKSEVADSLSRNFSRRLSKGGSTGKTQGGTGKNIPVGNIDLTKDVKVGGTVTENTSISKISGVKKTSFTKSFSTPTYTLRTEVQTSQRARLKITRSSSEGTKKSIGTQDLSVGTSTYSFAQKYKEASGIFNFDEGSLASSIKIAESSKNNALKDELTEIQSLVASSKQRGSQTYETTSKSFSHRLSLRGSSRTKQILEEEAKDISKKSPLKKNSDSSDLSSLEGTRFSIKVETTKGNSEQSIEINDIKHQRVVAGTGIQRFAMKNGDNPFNICDPELIDEMTAPRNQLYSVGTNDFIGPAYNYIDMLNYLNIIQSFDDYQHEIDDMKAKFISYTAKVTTFSTTLKRYRDTDLHNAGTTHLDIRGRSLIIQMKKRFGINTSSTSAASVPQNLDIFHQTLQNFDLDEKVINTFGDRFDAEQGLFNGDKFVGKLHPDLVAKGVQWSGYFKIYQSLKIELCSLAYKLVEIYTTDKSPLYISKYSGQKLTGDKKIENDVNNELAATYLIQFQDLLLKRDASDVTGKCGQGSDLREIFQIQFLKKSLAKTSFMTQSITFFSESFFGYVLSKSSSNLHTMVNFDLLFIRKSYTEIDLEFITAATKLSVDGAFLHVEFFDDLFTLKIKQKDTTGKEVNVEYNIGKLFVQFYSGNFPTTITITEEVELQFHYFKMVYILYELYVLARSTSSTPLTPSSSLRDIYTYMFQILTNYNFEDGYLYYDFLIEVRAITLSFLCGKIDQKYCAEDQLKIVVPKLHKDLPDPQPLPKPSIWKYLVIITFIQKYYESLNVDFVLKTFETDFISVIITNIKCNPVTRKELYKSTSTTTAQTGNVKTETTETKTTYYDLNADCTKVAYEKTEIFLRKTILEFNFDIDLLIKRIILFIFGRDGIQKDLVRYILIRIITTWKLNPPKDIQDKWKIIIVRIFAELEDRVLGNGRLDFRKTAGLYYFYNQIYGGWAGSQKSKQDFIMKRSMIDNNVAKWDLYYLGHIAAWQTSLGDSDAGQKFAFANLVNTMRSSGLPQIFSTLSGQKMTGNELKTLDRGIQKCRSLTYTKKFGNDVTPVAASECDQIQGSEKLTGTGFDPADPSLCLVDENVDFKDCDTNIVHDLVNYLFTIDIIIQTVSVFDSFNLFSSDLLLSTEGKKVGVIPPLITPVHNKRFFVATYLHLQEIRRNIESDIEDVPNYALRKIVNCLEAFEKKNELKKDSDKGSACPFDQHTYGSMFWVLRHTFQRRQVTSVYDLSSWTGGTPMGTTYFIQLMVMNNNYRNSFESMCPTDDSIAPDICLVVKLVLKWVEWVREIIDQSSETGIGFVDATLGFTELINQINAKLISDDKKRLATSTYLRRRFCLLEALHAVFYILRHDATQMEVVKNSLDYKDATNGGLFLTMRTFEYSTNPSNDEIDAMANYLRFSFRKTMISAEEKSLYDIATKIYADSAPANFEFKNDKVDLTKLSLLGKLIHFNGAGFANGIRMMAMYGQTFEQHKKLAQELRNLRVFIDAVIIEFNFEHLTNIIQRLTANGNDIRSGMQAFFLEIQNLKTISVSDGLTSFDQATGLGEGKDYMQSNIDVKIGLEFDADFTNPEMLEMLMAEAQSRQIEQDMAQYKKESETVAGGGQSKEDQTIVQENVLIASRQKSQYELVSKEERQEIIEYEQVTIVEYKEEQKKEISQEIVELRASFVKQQRRRLAVDDYLMPKPRSRNSRSLTQKGGPSTNKNQPIRANHNLFDTGVGAKNSENTEAPSRLIEALDLARSDKLAKSYVWVGEEDIGKSTTKDLSQGMHLQGSLTGTAKVTKFACQSADLPTTKSHKFQGDTSQLRIIQENMSELKVREEIFGPGRWSQHIKAADVKTQMLNATKPPKLGTLDMGKEKKRSKESPFRLLL